MLLQDTVIVTQDTIAEWRQMWPCGPGAEQTISHYIYWHHLSSSRNSIAWVEVPYSTGIMSHVGILDTI